MPIVDASRYFQSNNAGDIAFSLENLDACASWNGEIPLGSYVAVLHSISLTADTGDGPLFMAFNVLGVVILALPG